MSGIIICKTKTADNPYTFLNTKITIYSYEELCYYIFNNMVLIGKDDLADRLSNWLRTAIDMGSCGQDRRAQCQECVYPGYHGGDTYIW